MYFWSFKGKNKNVLEWPKNHFKDVNKVADFPYVRGGGVNQHMENSVCFLHIIFESFPKSFKVLLVLMKDECRIIVFF